MDIKKALSSVRIIGDRVAARHARDTPMTVMPRPELLVSRQDRRRMRHYHDSAVLEGYLANIKSPGRPESTAIPWSLERHGHRLTTTLGRVQRPNAKRLSVIAPRSPWALCNLVPGAR